jgi:hypothetical protein
VVFSDVPFSFTQNVEGDFYWRKYNAAMWLAPYVIASALIVLVVFRVVRYCRLINRVPKVKLPVAPFIDQALGRFDVDESGLWTAHVQLGGREAELVLGSDGEPPSEEMLRTARAWVNEWPARYPQIINYIGLELRKWHSNRQDVSNSLHPERFEVVSIDLLWRMRPNTAMVYFNYPGDDFRLWHATFEGFEPKGFAFDD